MTKNNAAETHPASFRDPSGFVFTKGSVLYRQINSVYAEEYEKLMKSGLYKKLTHENLLISHKEVALEKRMSSDAYKVIAPDHITTISYPYEWSFSQLKDAALTTLDIQLEALEYEMSLKDASAYNIQFHAGKPLFIDTLSFETYTKGSAWIAYKQFCQHFLAPLTLCAYSDNRLSQLLRVYIDGIPLDLTSKLLPKKTWFDVGILSHIHMHGRSQQKYSDNAVSLSDHVGKMSMPALKALLTSLKNTVANLKLPTSKTEWGHYYTFTNYSDAAFKTKKSIVKNFITLAKPKLLWDLGANTGEFTQIAADVGIESVAWDIDPLAVEFGYLQVKKKAEKKLLPLLLDLTNPSTGLGWANTERASFTDRGPVDTVMALALIHHLSLSNNLPFESTAAFFASIARHLIIEFVPKGDSQVDKLLKNREDIFDSYNLDSFEKTYSRYFKIVKKEHIKGTKRTMYLMKQI